MNAKSKDARKPKRATNSNRNSDVTSKPKVKRPRAAVTSTRVKDRSRLSERMSKKTRTSLFVRALVPDFLLVLLVSVALAYTVSFGFESAPSLRTDPVLIALLNLPLLAAMFWGTWSKRMLGPSVIATVVIAVIIVAAFIIASPPGGEMVANSDEGYAYAAVEINDVPENYGIFAIVVVVCSAVTFLLSRRTTGLVVLLVLAVVSCGAIQFLYRDWISENPGIAATVVVLFGIGMLFVYQCYRQSVYSANRVKKTSFPGAFAFSAIVGLACVLVGVGVYYGIVAGMELTTPEIKPLAEYVSPPETENPEDYQHNTDKGDDTSNNVDEDNQEDNGSQGTDSGGIGDALGFLENTIVADLVKSAMDYDTNSPESDNGATLPLILAITAIIFAILILIAIVLFVLFWRYRREIRLRLIARRSNRFQVWYLYTFLVGRLSRLRMRKPKNLTPMEYALGFERPMVPFTRNTGGIDFVDVTEIYQDAVFGAEEPTSADVEDVISYYRAFFKNARIHVGWPKWLLWKFWRI